MSFDFNGHLRACTSAFRFGPKPADQSGVFKTASKLSISRQQSGKGPFGLQSSMKAGNLALGTAEEKSACFASGSSLCKTLLRLSSSDVKRGSSQDVPVAAAL